jgi:hypothetical protein
MTRGGQEKIDKDGKDRKRDGCEVTRGGEEEVGGTRGGQEEVGGLGEDKKRLED